MGKTTKNATVAAVQQSMQQQAAANIKNVAAQKPVSRPQTPIAQKAAMPLAAKPVFSSAANKPASPAPTVKGNPLAPLTRGKAAAGIPDNVFGNMFDLPPKWVNACKPAKPVARLLGASKNHSQIQKQQHQQQKKFTRKPRAPKNSTSEVFNIAFLYPEAKSFATVQPVPPKRAAATKKPVQASRPTSAPSKPATPSKAMARPTTAGGKTQKSNSSPVDWQQNIWEDFYTSNKHHTYVETKAPAKSAAPKAAPNVNPAKRPVSSGGRKQQHASLKSSIPAPKEAKSPEIFSFLH